MRKEVWKIAAFATVIFVAVTAIGIPTVHERITDHKQAERCEFIQSLTNPGSQWYTERIVEWYMGERGGENLIHIAANYFPEIYGCPYTVGSEAKMVEIMTRGKYTVKQGLRYQKIVRIKQ